MDIRNFLNRVQWRRRHDDEAADSSGSTESSPLIKPLDGPGGEYLVVEPSSQASVGQWPQDVARCDGGGGTWLQEAKIIASCSLPLTVTFLLQYSIDTLSLVVAGKIGKLELGAVSLANMSAAITCFAPVQGLATSLDTLCAQAYGSGQKHLVGLYCQRVTLFLFCLIIPISALWLYAESVLKHLVADAEISRLASLYLRVLILAIPGFILFETGKRFLQAQGLFRATTYILLIAGPCHVFLAWLLVGRLGFIGAPIAVVITRTFIPLLLLLYVKFIRGSSCWGGLNQRAFSNWWTMIRLAIPGMIMVEAEYLAFEVMIIASSYFGTDSLAAQSILAAVATISFQIPFSISVSASTRIASLIGAGMVDAGKVAARVAITATWITGCLNFIIYLLFRVQLPFIFTDDVVVAALTTQVLPLLSVTTFFEGLCATAHGLLRGIGRQYIGGPATISAYYLVALPTSAALAFGLDWKLHGLLSGLTIGLIV
ncbi:hypothetical protein XA68_13391 [Ophiocordyceps unilateralis]|uniref:MATE efflux family protein n=1 Tax=Ophiocordyceps unilateralis TaxID=268505 RepID=A0A2A9PM93_OPHUN|nr:hypothetical protein XA68_13391 [Ophiocordyceps unilateralis]